MNNPPEKISAITKALSLFVACGIIFGLILGKTSPAFGSSLAKFIPVGLFLMIFPQMVKVDLGKVKEAFRGGKQLLITPLYNYLCSPFLVFLLAYIFLPDEPYLRTGLILTGVAPCIAMVTLWSGISGGNLSLSATLSAMDSILQVFLTPFYIALLVWAVPYDQSIILKLIAMYLGLPLIVGNIVRYGILKYKGEEGLERLEPYLEKTWLIGLVFTLVVMFSSGGEHILANPWHLARIAIPLIIFFFIQFILIFKTCKNLNLSYEDSVSIAFNGTGMNFELAIAIALSAFPARVAVATVMCPLIEVPVMLMLVRYAKNRRYQFTKSKEVGENHNRDLASFRRQVVAHALMSRAKQKTQTNETGSFDAKLVDTEKLPEILIKKGK